MKNILSIIVVVLTGIIIFLLLRSPKVVDYSHWEKKMFWDSLTIAEQNKTIKELENHIDSLESDTVFIKIKEYQIDTVLVNKYIEKGDTCAELLRQQREYIKLQTIGIKRLQTINDNQEALIEAIRVKLRKTQEMMISQRRFYEQKEKQNKKDLKKTKWIARGTIIGGIVFLVYAVLH